MSSPLPGYTSTETFPAVLDFGSLMRRLVVLLVMFFVVVASAVALIVYVTGVHSLLAWLPGIVVAGGLTGLLVLWKRRQFAATWGGAVLELSPEGAVTRDRYTCVRLSWDAVRSIGEADLLAPLRLRVRPGSLVTYVVGEVASGSVRRRVGKDSLVGPGTLEVREGAPAMVRSQVGQNLGGRAPDAETGLPLVAVILANYDRDWRNGRIGAWVVAYRPDLLG